MSEELPSSALFERVDALCESDMNGDQVVVAGIACVGEDKGGKNGDRKCRRDHKADTSACRAELDRRCDRRDRKKTAQKIQKKRFGVEPRSCGRPRELLEEDFCGSKGLDEQQNNDPLDKDKVRFEFEATAFFGEEEREDARNWEEQIKQQRSMRILLVVALDVRKDLETFAKDCEALKFFHALFGDHRSDHRGSKEDIGEDQKFRFTEQHTTGRKNDRQRRQQNKAKQQIQRAAKESIGLVGGLGRWKHDDPFSAFQGVRVAWSSGSRKRMWQ